MVDLVLYGAGLLVMLKAATTLVAWTRMLSMRFRPPEIVRTARENVAPEIAPIFRDAQERLAELGFAYSHSQWVRSPAASDPPRPCEVYADADGCYATVCPALLYNGTRVFDVTFTTPFEDGVTVVTSDSSEHLMPVVPPSWELHDHYLNDHAEQLRRHRGSVAERAVVCDVARLDVDDWMARERDELRAAFADLESSGGAVVDADSGHLELRPLAAWRMARKVRSGHRRLGREGRERALKGEAPAAGPPQVAADIYAFVRNEASEGARRQSSRLKLALFVLSMVGFVLAFGWFWSWRTVPLLLGVVLIHELGHLAGMALFGYRDRQILFVPFLGAAALGKNDDATPLQKLIIYLLGPIPGIALGFACLRVGAISGGWFWNELAVIAIVINYLNLLPLTPLDGGRVVETILLSRFPRAQAMFLVVSAAVFGVVGLFVLDPILLVLAGFMALSLPAKWRWGAVARELSRTLPGGAGKRERLHAVFTALNEPRFVKLESTGKLEMAKGLMAYLQERRPGLGTSLAGATLYVAALVAPVVGYAGYLMSGPELAVEAAPATLRQPSEPALDAEEDAPRELRAAMRRGGTPVLVAAVRHPSPPAHDVGPRATSAFHERAVVVDGVPVAFKAPPRRPAGP